MPGATLHFLYPMSCLTPVQLCETGTIPLQTRELKRRAWWPSQVGRWSDPAPALAVTVLSCCLWSPLSPSPLSEPVPIKPRSLRGTLSVGTWTLPLTPTSWNCCLSHRRWGWALGLPPWSFSLTFSHKGQSSQQGPLGSGVVSRNLFLLVKNMGFPNNAGESGRDAAGVLMVVGQIWLPERHPHPIMTEEHSPAVSVSNPDPDSPMPL